MATECSICSGLSSTEGLHAAEHLQSVWRVPQLGGVPLTYAEYSALSCTPDKDGHKNALLTAITNREVTEAGVSEFEQQGDCFSASDCKPYAGP